MKILHTSDWHLGHVLYGYGREDEQRFFLEQLKEAAEAERPDVMLVTGDIFHTSTPAASTTRMYNEYMLDIHRSVPDMVVIVTAGNHDGRAQLLETVSLWDEFNVKVFAGIDRVNPGNHIVEIRKRGELLGFVGAVPFANPGEFPHMNPEKPSDFTGTSDSGSKPDMMDEGNWKFRIGSFYRSIEESIAERNHDGLPVIMTGHLTITGSMTGDKDMGAIGGLEPVPVSSFGDGYDYLALGHIHRPQNITERIRYAGSPLAVSFDESYAHSLSIVEINSHGELPELRTIEIKNPHPLVTLPVRHTGTFNEALAELETYPADMESFIRLNAIAPLPPLAMEKALAAIAGKSCRLCLVNPVKEGMGNSENGLGTVEKTVEEFRLMSPLKVAMDYIDGKNVFSEEDMDEFKTMLSELLKLKDIQMPE